MADALAGFIRTLRRKGLRISPPERIDASRAALALGLESRSALRGALRSTLAKNPLDIRVFDEAFEEYFAVPRSRKTTGPGDRRAASVSAGSHAGGPGSGSGKPGRPTTPDRQRIRRESPPRAPFHPKPGDTIPGKAARESRERSPRGPRSGRDARILTSEGRTAAPDFPPGSRTGAPVPGRPADPKRRDLRSPASTEEEASLAREIGSIIQTIRLRRGRRLVRGPRGKIWMKKVIRDSLAHGGVPFELPMRERRPRIPRVVLLVDVSHSVARASGLFLLICLGLRERLRRVQILLFVDRVIDGTDIVSSWASSRATPKTVRPGTSRRATPGSGVSSRRGGASFADLLGSIPDLNVMAPSDYGRAFYQARAHLTRAAGRDAVLVILGDARSNRRDPLVWAFDEIAERCRRVIWLNPESRSLWDTADSVMDAYLPSCDVVCETRNLAGLARGVREILRAL